MRKIPLQRLLALAAIAIALTASFYYVVLAPAAQKPVDVRPAINAGLGFLSGVNVTADTLDEGEQRIPAEEKYENMSELALYRKTDFMLDLHFIGGEVREVGPLKTGVEDSDRFLRGLAMRWQDGSIDYSYFDAGGEKGEYAFDLYCMIALETGNGKMAEKIRAAAREEGWSTPQAQEFRVIIDESWCMMALAEYGDDAKRLSRLFEAKKKQLSAYLPAGKGGEIEEIRRSYAATHVLMMLDYLKKKGYDVGEYAGYEKELQEKIFADAMAHLDSTDYLSNSLYFLAKSGYPKQKLAPLAEALVRLQAQDGGWNSMFSQQMFRGLLSARAVLALNAYSEMEG